MNTKLAVSSTDEAWNLIASISIKEKGYQLLGGIFASMTMSDAKKYLTGHGWRFVESYRYGAGRNVGPWVREIYSNEYGNEFMLETSDEKTVSSAVLWIGDEIRWRVAEQVENGTYDPAYIQRMFQ